MGARALKGEGRRVYRVIFPSYRFTTLGTSTLQGDVALFVVSCCSLYVPTLVSMPSARIYPLLVPDPSFENVGLVSGICLGIGCQAGLRRHENAILFIL